MAVERGLCCRALFFSVLPVSPHSGRLSLDGLAASERKRNPLHATSTNSLFPPIRTLSTCKCHCDSINTNIKTHDNKDAYHNVHNGCVLVVCDCEFSIMKLKRLPTAQRTMPTRGKREHICTQTHKSVNQTRVNMLIALSTFTPVYKQAEGHCG